MKRTNINIFVVFVAKNLLIEHLLLKYISYDNILSLKMPVEHSKHSIIAPSHLHCKSYENGITFREKKMHLKSCYAVECPSPNQLKFQLGHGFL